jgi:hypothetical protein
LPYNNQWKARGYPIELLEAHREKEREIEISKNFKAKDLPYQFVV